MTEDKIEDMVIQITSSLAELNANMKNVLACLTQHESRLTKLEDKKDGDWKSQLIMLLAKSAIIAVVSLGSAVGAGGLISKFLGQ